MTRIAILLSTCVTLAASSAAAQTPVSTPPQASPMGTQRIEMSIGYQLLHVPGETFPFGLNVDLAARLYPQLDVVGEAGLARDQRNDPRFAGTMTFLNFGAGPRWTRRVGSYVPFAQLLAGAASPSATLTPSTGQLQSREWAFMLQPGVGVAVPMAHAFGLVGQIDYRRVFFREAGENELRFFAGLRVTMR